MRFESLESMKFQTLEKEQLSTILGGAKCATPAGDKWVNSKIVYSYSADTTTSHADGTTTTTDHTGKNDKSDADVNCSDVTWDDGL